MDPPRPNIVHLVPQNLLSFQLGQKGVLLLFLILFDRYRPAPLMHHLSLFLLVWAIELNQRICTFSVWILSDLNLDFF